MVVKNIFSRVKYFDLELNQVKQIIYKVKTYMRRIFLIECLICAYFFFVYCVWYVTWIKSPIKTLNNQNSAVCICAIRLTSKYIQ